MRPVQITAMWLLRAKPPHPTHLRSIDIKWYPWISMDILGYPITSMHWKNLGYDAKFPNISGVLRLGATSTTIRLWFCCWLRFVWIVGAIHFRRVMGSDCLLFNCHRSSHVGRNAASSPYSNDNASMDAKVTTKTCDNRQLAKRRDPWWCISDCIYHDIWTTYRFFFSIH